MASEFFSFLVFVLTKIPSAFSFFSSHAKIAPPTPNNNKIMGSGVSVPRDAGGAFLLPESLSAEEAAELFGAAFNEEKFQALADPETERVSREALLEAQAELEEQFEPPEPESPETPPDMRTVEEISDDEFEEELKTITSSRFQATTHKITVHLYARNHETNMGCGNSTLGGEVSFLGHSTVVGTTLLPPSSSLGGGGTTNSRNKLNPIAMSFDIRVGHMATFKWVACVAAQRYEAETLRAGTQRHRELQGTAVVGARFLPCYVSTRPDNDSFHAPSDRLFHANPKKKKKKRRRKRGGDEEADGGEGEGDEEGDEESALGDGTVGQDPARPGSSSSSSRQQQQPPWADSGDDGPPLREGGELWVTIDDRVTVDGSAEQGNLGGPAFTRWATLAFSHRRPELQVTTPDRRSYSKTKIGKSRPS